MRTGKRRYIECFVIFFDSTTEELLAFWIVLVLTFFQSRARFVVFAVTAMLNLSVRAALFLLLPRDHWFSYARRIYQLHFDDVPGPQSEADAFADCCAELSANRRWILLFLLLLTSYMFFLDWFHGLTMAVNLTLCCLVIYLSVIFYCRCIQMLEIALLRSYEQFLTMADDQIDTEIAQLQSSMHSYVFWRPRLKKHKHLVATRCPRKR